MELTGKRVFNLARLRQTPREIEITLGLPPYRIHETYHRELMYGYLEAESVSPANDSDSDKQEKTDARRRFYYEANREKFVKENAGITKHTKKNIKNVNADIANGEKTKEF